MAPQTTLIVSGVPELLRAIAQMPPATKRECRKALRVIGEKVRAEGQSRFTEYNPVSAAGYRVYVRARGISVEQKYNKVDGSRPDYGPLQMDRALIPALEMYGEDTEGALEDALARVEAAIWNSGL